VLDATNMIISEFEKEVDLIIDDGDKKNALPSTLVMLENGKVKVLRQGSLKI
jgi:L-threonylcarbamoyladenylate synthase